MALIGNIMAKKQLLTGAIVFGLTLLISCGGDKKEHKSNTTNNQNNNQNQTGPVVNKPKRMTFDYPANNNLFAIGETVNIEASPVQLEEQPDSAILFIDGKEVLSTSQYPVSYNWETKQAKMGTHNIKLVSWFGDEKEEVLVTTQIKSDVEPVEYTYQVVKKYPHDKHAYSQGLIYEDGVLYEGTGQYGESTIRKVELETGKVLSYFNMPSDIFGEGIAIIAKKIYQVSWRAQKGYVYDKESFERLNQFTYNTQSTEGWGLTTDGKKLFLTDGTHRLYEMDKDNFSITKTTEVYNNIGPIGNLNELEYIDGKIYANVYLTDYIVVIDPETGKITGQIDLKGLLESTKYTGEVDVLNGIAWDAKNKRLFVTGKWWPYIFEIKLIKK